MTVTIKAPLMPGTAVATLLKAPVVQAAPVFKAAALASHWMKEMENGWIGILSCPAPARRRHPEAHKSPIPKKNGENGSQCQTRGLPIQCLSQLSLHSGGNLRPLEFLSQPTLLPGRKMPKTRKRTGPGKRALVQRIKERTTNGRSSDERW